MNPDACDLKCLHIRSPNPHTDYLRVRMCVLVPLGHLAFTWSGCTNACVQVWDDKTYELLVSRTFKEACIKGESCAIGDNLFGFLGQKSSG